MSSAAHTCMAGWSDSGHADTRQAHSPIGWVTVEAFCGLRTPLICKQPVNPNPTDYEQQLAAQKASSVHKEHLKRF